MGNADARELGERIRDARRRADLNQEELGRAIGLDRTVVNKIEAGIRKVTALELADIAAATEVRMSSFFESTIPALVSHRSSQGLDTADSQVDALLAKFAGETEFIASLGVDELGVASADAVAHAEIHPPSDHVEVEALAVRVRKLMGKSAAEPINRLAECVSGLGLLVFSRDLGKDTADAGTILLRRGAVTLINSHMRVGRRRLALGHELGHYLIADDYAVDWRVAANAEQVSPMESRLDRFARALLLPESALVSSWAESVDRRGLRTTAIVAASEFRVDMATLATRVKEIGVADGDTAALVRGYRTARADIVDLDLHVPLEEMEGTTVPRGFARAVLRLVRDERISRERALDLLQGTFDESELPQIRGRRPDEIWKYVS